MHKAIFLDRDGVINKLILRNNKPDSPKNLSELEFLPNVDLALKKAKEMGLLTIIITNQPEIARGRFLYEEVEEIHNYIKQHLLIDDIFMCPHDDVDNCNCRKPKPGMIYKAKEKWNIDLKNSFVIGDRWRDIEAGKQAGCITFLVKSEYYEENKNANYDYLVDDLYSAIEIISKLL